ncbi:MAG: ankyrin repeat domain-containing protein [Bacteroidota bacterium]
MRKHIIFFLLLFPLTIFGQSSTDELKSIIQTDDVEAMVKFLEHEKSINDCYEAGGSSYSILVLSIKYDKGGIFKKCLEMGADLDKICEDKTPLMYAIKYDRRDYFHALIKAGADTKVKSVKGKSLTDYAFKYGQDYFKRQLK